MTETLFASFVISIIIIIAAFFWLHQSGKQDIEKYSDYDNE